MTNKKIVLRDWRKTESHGATHMHYFAYREMFIVKHGRCLATTIV